MISNLFIQNGEILRAGAFPFRLKFRADDLKLPFAGTIVVPRTVPIAPESDQTVIDRMKLQNMHDWLFLSFRYPRRNKVVDDDPEVHEKVFPGLRGPDNRPFRIVADKLIFLVEKDYSPLDDLQFSNLFSDVGNVYSPRYKQNTSLSSRPKVLLIHLDSAANLSNTNIVPLTRDAGTRLKGSDPIDSALGPLRDALTGAPLTGHIYAFDLGGHQVETMSAMTALGVPRAHITEDLESNHPDNKPYAGKLYMQFVNVHGDPLTLYDLPAAALAITPMPTPIEDQGNLEIYHLDMPSAGYKVKFERKTLAGIPAAEQYKYNFVHVGLWPGSGSRLQPVAEGSSVTFDLLNDLDQNAEVPQFVRFCLFNPADEFQTEAGGNIDDKGDFSTNKFKFFTDHNEVSVFNTGADYFADLVKELNAPGEDVQALYLLNWSSQAHLFMSGQMSAYGVAPNESEPAAIERLLGQEVNAPGKTLLVPIDAAEEPDGPPPLDRGFLLLTRRESERTQIGQAFQARVKSTATSEHPDTGETHRGFVRPHSLCAIQLAAAGGNPRPHQLTASWKNSLGDVSTLTQNLILPAKHDPMLRFPLSAVELDINGDDPPKATLVRNVSYAAFVDLLKAADPSFTDAGKNLQLLVLRLKAGRYEFIPLNTPGNIAVLHTFDKLIATDPVAIAVVNRRPESQQDFAVDLLTRFRLIEYSVDEFQTGNVPLSTGEWGGILRRLIASKPADKSPVKAIYWENYLANLDKNQDLARGINNNAELTAVINRTVNGRRGYAIRDRSTRPFGSFHQKATVLVKTVNEVLPRTKVIAYVGGIDLAYSRWDREEHHRLDPERQNGSGWHDVQAKIVGDGAMDVLRNFKQRWEALGQLIDLSPTGPTSACRPVNVPQDLNTALKSTIPLPSTNVYTPDPGPFVQITRTIPPNSCYHNGLTGEKRFVGEAGELGSYETYLKAIRNARKFILIHDQYFFGIEVARAVHDVLLDPKGPEFAIVVLPKDLGEAEIVDPLIYKIRQRSLHALLYGADPIALAPKDQPQRFVIRTPGNGTPVADKLVILSPINRDGDEIYVHSKHMVVDDVFMSIGSANYTYRGTTYEMEINASILGNRMNRGGTDVVRRHRVELCRRMLGLPRTYGPILQDPQAAFRLFKALELESGQGAIDGVTRAPSVNLHPLKPMVKKVDPVYAKRVSTNVPFNANVAFVMATSNNSPGLDFIARNVVENDGRDRQHDLLGGLAAFASIQFELAGISMGGFTKNSVTAYARTTFDFSPLTETAIRSRLSAGEATFLDVSLIYGQLPGETPPDVPESLRIHHYPIKLSAQNRIEIDGLEVNELFVPISTTRPVTIRGVLTDADVVSLNHEGERLFNPLAPGSTILPGSFTSATITVNQVAAQQTAVGQVVTEWSGTVNQEV